MALFASLRSKGGAPRGLEVPSPFAQTSPEQKALLTAYYGALQSMSGRYGTERAREWPIERAMREGYDRVMWVFRAVEVCAGNASRLPWQPTNTDGEPIKGHPLSDLLNRRANPLETGQQFRKRLGAQFLLSKAGVFVQLTKTYGNRVTRVDLLPPGRTKPIFGDWKNPILQWEITSPTGQRRYLDADLVLWFRNPHPLDPYSGVTPLESAGLSIELDHFARLYNAAFVQNDKRPGTILAVKTPSGGAPSDKSMDRLESRFEGGPAGAGKMSVIAGEATLLDPAASSMRDLAYGDLSHVTKTEILSAFGVAESVLGSSADRTFSNAGQDLENFWATEPMPAYLDHLATGWNPVMAEGEIPAWDTSKVAALQAIKAREREEARAEVAAGLRSIKSYVDLAGRGDEVDDLPSTRALYVPSGSSAIPSREADAAELSGTGEAPAEDPAVSADVPPPPGPAAAAVEAATSGVRPAAPAGRAAPPAIPAQSRTAADIVGQLQAKAMPRSGRARRARAVLRVVPVDEEAVREDAPDQATLDQAEKAVGDALEALAERYIERSVARIQSPRARKGTRHFIAQHDVDTRVGTKALDTSKAVDEDTWEQDAQTVVRPYVEAAAAAAAAAALAALLSDEDDGRPVVDAAITGAAVAAALVLVAASARKQARALSATLNAADQEGQPMAEIVSRARGFGGRLKTWARGLATQVVVAAVEGARDSTVEDAIRSGRIKREDVRRTWISRRDGLVRETHRKADGQTVRMGTSFRVGDALLRFPGDPLGPPSETRNCRCFVVLSHGVRRARLSA